MTKRLENKIAVVTGASRGIGYSVAKTLAKEGAHVIAIARTVGGLEDLDDEIKSAGGAATLVPADLTDFDAIDRLGAAIHERWGKLDILIGNAGMLGKLSPLGHIEPKTWEDTFALNVTANWRLIRSLDPLLQASPAGRALFITSSSAQSCPAYWGVYSASKAALEALAKTYNAEMKTSSLDITLVNPGPVRTALRARAMPGEDPDKLTRPIDFAPALIPVLLPEWQNDSVVLDYRNGVLEPRSTS